jgi:ankyrin repeat protein
VVRLLLDNGADVNARGGIYGNALNAASYNGHEQVEKLLIDKGADADLYRIVRRHAGFPPHMEG